MIEQAYGAVLVIVVGSIIVGRAICLRCGGLGRWWAAPLVGLAALMVLAEASIKLPGRAVTAVVVCALAVVLAAIYLLWGRAGAPSSRSRLAQRTAGDALIGALVTFAASIPFIGQDRVGTGALLDGDMSLHLIMAESLRSPKMASYYHAVSAGYPTGPHALVATVGTAIGANLMQVFAGLLISIMVLTAIVAGDVLHDEVLWRRTVVGVLCAAGYLVAAYYGEGAFKETIMAGLVLAFALHVQQVRARWASAARVRRFTMVLPVGALVAGGIYAYSYLAIAWFGATLVAWVVLEVATRPALARELANKHNVKAVAPWAAAFAVLGLIVLVPIASKIGTVFGAVGLSPTSVISTSDLGNLIGPLSGYEALGIWLSGDFRVAPSNLFHAGELGAVALAILVFGAIWSVRRHQLPLLAAVLGCTLVWLYANRTQSPYVAAKALVIATPVLLALGLRALLTSGQGTRLVSAVLVAVAAIFGVAAADSSFTALRNEPVQSSETVAELAAFHRIAGNAKILFLGIDQWSNWELHDSPAAVLTPGTEYVSGAESPPNKPFGGQPLDYDSLTAPSLDNFAYVVTTNTDFASQPPSNFHLVARRPLYELWQRRGPTPNFHSIEGPGQPGAVLDCHNPVLRELSRQNGIAAVMTTPIQVAGVGGLAPGNSGVVNLPLPAGRWELSIQYIGWTPMSFVVQGRRYAMPAYMGENGPFFNLAAVTSRGAGAPIAVKVTASRPSVLTGTMPWDHLYNVVATRLPDVRQIMPLRKACGKYVDWYRTS